MTTHDRIAQVAELVAVAVATSQRVVADTDNRMRVQAEALRETRRFNARLRQSLKARKTS